MQTLEESYDQVLLESSLSRIYRYVAKHDCAILTAFREVKKHCISSHDDKPYGAIYTSAEKRARNDQLEAALLGFGYGITPIRGLWIDNFGTPSAVTNKEESFFVVNRKDDPKFIENIITLGKYFCQASVLLKPKDEDKAYLYGTNTENFPGLNNKMELGPFRAGFERMFMSSIRGRNFSFDSDPTDGFTPDPTVIKPFDTRTGKPTFIDVPENYNISTRYYHFHKTKEKILQEMIEHT